MAEETKNTKPADEEIEKTAEPTAGEEKQPETEKAESDTAAAKEEQPEKKGFFGKKKEKKDKKNSRLINMRRIGSTVRVDCVFRRFDI